MSPTIPSYIPEHNKIQYQGGIREKKCFFFLFSMGLDVKEPGEGVSTNFKKARNLIRKDFI